ncbi:MAG: hypothetical protein PHC78_03920 [Verrucomicrobiota bacterium]|nr:hypothetical protein [Verrucomicrobiota bacterium]
MRGTTSRAAARGPEAPREGRRSAARLGVLLHGGRAPRARSEVRCGWSEGSVLEDDEPAVEKKLMIVGYG